LISTGIPGIPVRTPAKIREQNRNGYIPRMAFLE